MKIRKLENGELASIILFGMLSVVLLVLSIQMFREEMDLSSQGAFPLLLSSLMLVMVVLMFIELNRYDRAIDKGAVLSEKIKAIYAYLFAGKILPMIIMIVIYAIALPRIGFIISSFLYLFVSMVMLKREAIKKSLLASIGIVAFILVIFQFIFKVILP